MNNQQSSDTVSVRLSAAGQAAAKGGELSIHGGNVSLTFKGDVAQQVQRAVWHETLATTAPFGKPWFEIAPAGTSTAVAPAPVATSTTSTLAK